MLHIKFRGKKETITNENEDYLNKGWVYGNSLYQDDSGMYLIPFKIDKTIFSPENSLFLYYLEKIW